MIQIKHLYSNIKKEPDQHLLMLLLFVLPFERIPSVNFFGITFRFSLLVGVAIILRTAYLVYTKKISFKLITPYKLLAIFLLWIVLIIPESINLKRAVQIVTFDCYVFLLAISISLLYKKKYLQPMVVSLFFGAIIVSLFGIYQYFGDLFGISNKFTGLRESYTKDLFGFPRVQSTGLEPLYFASYLLFPTAIISALVLTKTKISTFSNKIILATLVIFSLLIFLTVSRGAIYGLIVMAVFLSGLAIYKKLTSLKQIGVFFGAIIIAFGLSWLLINYINKSPSELFSKKRGAAVYSEQITKTTINDSGDERAIARKNAINILKTERYAVVIGIGPGQYGAYIKQLNNESGEGWTIVNNETLELIVEFGIIGFSLFIIFMSYVFIKGLKAMSKKDIFVSSVIMGLLGFLVAEAVQYQSFSTLYVTHIWVVVGLLIGLQIQSKAGSSQRSKKN